MNPASEVTALAELTAADLKALREDSGSLNALAWLWIAGAAIFILAGILAPADEAPFNPLVFNGSLIAIGVLQLVIAIGVLKRRAWARTGGMALCVLMVPGIPIGTVMGILGWKAFRRSRSLWGEGRYEAHALNREQYRRWAEARLSAQRATEAGEAGVPPNQAIDASAALPANAICRRCGYDLVFAADNLCTECGRVFEPSNPRSYARARYDGYRLLGIPLPYLPAFFGNLLAIVVPMFVLSLDFEHLEMGRARTGSELDRTAMAVILIAFASLLIGVPIAWWTGARSGRRRHALFGSLLCCTPIGVSAVATVALVYVFKWSM